MIEYGHFIGGKRVAGTSGAPAGCHEPMDGTVGERGAGLAGGTARRRRGREGGAAEMAATNPQRRVRVLMKFLELVQRDYDELADILAASTARQSPMPGATYSAGWKWSRSASAPRTC